MEGCLTDEEPHFDPAKASGVFRLSTPDQPISSTPSRTELNVIPLRRELTHIEPRSPARMQFPCVLNLTGRFWSLEFRFKPHKVDGRKEKRYQCHD